MKLSVIRHGETIENATGVVQGQLPGTLSKKGINQAIKAADELRDISFDAVYCSDLQRCVDTTEHLLARHKQLPITYVKDLREISFGDYQGKHVSELPDWDSLEGVFYTRRLPGGETINEFRLRTISFINTLFARHKDNHLLLVTHGGNIRVIRSLVEEINLWNLYQEKPDNCSIWEFSISQPVSR